MFKNVKVEGDKLAAINCRLSGAKSEITFVLESGQEIALDDDALLLEGLALQGALRNAAEGKRDVTEDLDSLVERMRAEIEEHARTCPNCGPKFRARGQA